MSSAYGNRRPSALQLQQEASTSTSSGVQEEMASGSAMTDGGALPHISKRLPFMHAPSTPMFRVQSEGSDVEASNPYEEQLQPAGASPRIGMHDTRRSISGSAGIREKGGDYLDEEEYEDPYAATGRKPSRIRGSLSGSAQQPLLASTSAFMLDESDSPRNFLSRLSRGLSCRRLPLAAIVPALILGAILMALYDARASPLPSPTSYLRPHESAASTDLLDDLDYHPNGHVYLKEAALHSGRAVHPIIDLIQNATQQCVSVFCSGNCNLDECLQMGKETRFTKFDSSTGSSRIQETISQTSTERL